MQYSSGKVEQARAFNRRSASLLSILMSKAGELLFAQCVWGRCLRSLAPVFQLAAGVFVLLRLVG